MSTGLAQAVHHDAVRAQVVDQHALGDFQVQAVRGHAGFGQDGHHAAGQARLFEPRAVVLHGSYPAPWRLGKTLQELSLGRNFLHDLNAGQKDAGKPSTATAPEQVRHSTGKLP